jgi:small subunit ribosomal protein S20
VPKLKSSKKRLLTSHRAQMRNRAARSRMRTAIKTVHQATDQAAAQEALSWAFSTIDKTAKLKVIHKNMAARHKSRLTKWVQSMN